MKTHLLKHRHDGRREKRCVGYSQPNTSNISMKTHRLEHRHDGRREKRCVGYLQPNTSNNSMKTHLLKHRHDRGREKRYVVVTCSLIKQFNENSPPKACM